MLRKTAIISFIVVMVMCFSSFSVMADEFGSVPVDINNDYIDSNPKVWNTYIIWERGLDLDNPPNGNIDFDEPSWIMVHEITSGMSWNITPDIDASGTYNFHARNPDIYFNKIIYEYKRSATLTDFGLNMYNITRNETWNDIPIPLTHVRGNIQAIYGDWIFATNSIPTYNVGVIYNYKTNEYYSVSNTYRPNTGIDDISMHEKYITWTEIYTSSIQTIMVFNLDNLKCIQLSSENKDGNPSILKYPAVHNEIIIFSVLDKIPIQCYNLYGFELSSVNWSAVGDIHSPTVYDWNMMEENIFNVSVDFTKDVEKSKIWNNKVYYIDSVNNNKIYVYIINKDSTEIVLDIPYTIGLPDVHYDKVVWADNRAGVDNIYRLTTSIETFSMIMMLSIPLIMVGVVVVLFWKAFSGGVGGMS